MESVSKDIEANSLAMRVLVDQLRRREPASLMAVYDRYATSVFSLVLRITRDQTTAEDLVHELFNRLWKDSWRIDLVKASLRLWLLLTARKMAIDHVQACAGRTADRLTRPENWEHMPCGQDHIDFELIPELSIRLKAALLRLNSDQRRQVLELTYFGCYCQTEIASLLRLPLSTVKTGLRSELVNCVWNSMPKIAIMAKRLICLHVLPQSFHETGHRKVHLKAQMRNSNAAQGALSSPWFGWSSLPLEMQ